ncbi:alpha/beta hydrolase [Brevundimonas variabilis]|uniref:Acetyl esterase/lipase n=1 Tax=Brevundimonas variabilis TaxID=74312 RepID=A0A7W9FEV8_9CAUL|nr:alpha/beta hydrolase [Brevundimonas variabilis]MBB5746846.1 acetyl esterase/lipase [Brevundimonas variabilis]
MSIWKPGRRDLLGLAAAVGAMPAVGMARTPDVSVTPLWPGEAPGGEAVQVTEEVILRTPGGDPNDTAFLHVTRPFLMMRRPAVSNGASVLIIPGGGFRRVAVSRAGGTIDRWLASLGYTAFVMNYRLPADGWAAGADVSLQDAQRAIRVIRARAPSLGLDAERVAVLGFSAGGHVAARVATRFEQPAYAPLDAADALSTRPAACGLFFPVVTLTAPHAHGGSLKEMLGDAPSEEARNAVSAERHVPANAPPTFIAAAADDPVVPVENSLMMWSALRAQKIQSEMHLFEVGGHSLGGLNPADPAAAWPGLLTGFLTRHGLTTAA